MNKEDLIKILQDKDQDISKIQFEDYNGNFVCWIQDFDIADVETSEHGNILRLQLNSEEYIEFKRK